MRISFFRLIHVFFIGVASLLMNACSAPRKPDAYLESIRINYPETWARWTREEAIRDAQRTEVTGASMSCIDHGDYRASGFSVEEVAYGQISRGMIGGAFNCGGVLGLDYPVPLKWRPGLKVKVRWNTYAPKATEPTRHEKETTILPYSTVGSVYVHFFPGDQVRIVVTKFWPEGKDHPIPFDSTVPPAEIE